LGCCLAAVSAVSGESGLRSLVGWFCVVSG